MADIGSTEASTPELSGVNAPKQAGESRVEKIDRRVEKKLEEEQFNEKRKEAVGRIKSGEDVEGKRLYDAYLDSLKDPNVGDTSVLYIEAGKSVSDTNKPGEANKAVIAMDALYKISGSEGYKLDPKDIQPGLSPEEKQRFVREKITRDYSSLSERLADRFIDDYARSLVELQNGKKELKEKTSGEDLSRAEIRAASYKVEGLTGKLLHVIERSSASIGNTSLGEDLKIEVGGREGVTEYVSSKEFNQLSDEEQSGLIEASVEKFKSNLGENGKQQEAGLLDRMGEEKKIATFQPIAEVDQRIFNLRRNLEKNLNAEPWDICNMVSEIKELQLERKALITQANVSLVEQRFEEAKTGWENNLNKTLDNFIGGQDRRKALGDLVNAGKEWLSSGQALLKEHVKKGITDSLNRVISGLEKGEDFSEKKIEEIDEAFISESRNQVISTRERVSDVIGDARERSLRMRTESQNKRIDIERKLFEGIHDANLWWQESKASIASKGKELGMKAAVKATGLVAEATGRDLGAKVDARIAEIEALSVEDLRKRIESIKEENKDNPLFRVFSNDLEKRLLLIEKGKKAVEGTGMQKGVEAGSENIRGGNVKGVEEVKQNVEDKFQTQVRSSPGEDAAVREKATETTLEPQAREDLEQKINTEMESLIEENEQLNFIIRDKELRNSNKEIDIYETIIYTLTEAIRGEEDLNLKDYQIKALRKTITDKRNLINGDIGK